MDACRYDEHAAEKEGSMNTTILIKVLLVITLVGIIGAIVGGDR